MYTLAPFLRYCSTILQSGSEKITTRCHSVFSLRSPVALSRQDSEVATLRLAIGRPSCVRRISGSLPRFPTRITLFTLPAIAALHSRHHCTGPPPKPSAGGTGRRRRHARDHLAPTLYARPAREPGDRRLSTYSISSRNVPVLFLQIQGAGFMAAS